MKGAHPGAEGPPGRVGVGRRAVGRGHEKMSGAKRELTGDALQAARVEAREAARHAVAQTGYES